MFLITPEAPAVVDRLETSGPYVREEIEVVSGGDTRAAAPGHPPPHDIVDPL